MCITYISENCNWTSYDTDANLDDTIDNGDISAKIDLAKQGYGLDKLINEKSEYILAEIAKHGYGLDKLSNVDSIRVKREIIKHKYRLDKSIACHFLRKIMSKQVKTIYKCVNMCYNIYKFKS